MKPTSSQPESADLSFLAMAYFLDELSSAERDEFERRLESSQAAREALSSAVELHQAALVCCLAEERAVVAAAPRQSASSSPARLRAARFWGWAAVAGVAAAIGFVGLFTWPGTAEHRAPRGQLASSSERPTDARPERASASSNRRALRELAAAWSETRLVFSPDPFDGAFGADEFTASTGVEHRSEWMPLEEDASPWETGIAAFDSPQVEPTQEEPLVDAPIAEAPDWMVVALAGMRQRGHTDGSQEHAP